MFLNSATINYTSRVNLWATFVHYNSRVVNYNCRVFKRLGCDLMAFKMSRSSLFSTFATIQLAGNKKYKIIADSRIQTRAFWPVWRKSTALANILKKLAIYLRFIWFWGKFSTYFGTICAAIGHIFVAENGQILKTQFGHLVTLLLSSEVTSLSTVPLLIYMI